MNTYANLLLWVVPAFYLLIIIEIAYGHYKKNQTYNLMYTIASLSSGTTNLLKDILGLTLIIISYPFLLWGLSSFKKLSKNRMLDGIEFKDSLGSYLKNLNSDQI